MKQLISRELMRTLLGSAEDENAFKTCVLILDRFCTDEPTSAELKQFLAMNRRHDEAS